MSLGPLPGFRDFYPAELAERSHIFNAWREVARRYGFVEYDGPPLESLELYTRKSGDEIVGQLYNFTDKGNREVALRPEMTPTVARMVAARANALRKPVRWFSLPQLFRYERQQKGRLREHFQLNVDIFGEPGVAADAELLAVAIDIMRELGLGPDDVRARVSSRELLNAILESQSVESGSWTAVYAVLDKIDRQPRDVSREKLAAAGLSEQQVAMVLGLPELRSVEDIAALMRISDVSNDHPLGRMKTYLSILGELGVAEYVQVDLAIVRGLAYYTGIVFELFDARGEFRAICGGGRYDNLLEALGGVSMPGVGFGMGDVVLGELLRARGRMPASANVIDYWVAEGEQPGLSAPALARDLRRKGRSVEYALREQSANKQFKTAIAAGARRFVVIGPERRVRVRALDDSRSEHELSIEEFLASA